ncbi:MAG: 2Fe-2S iron-sulfur cluster-binding protein, partial [Stellaceae bacterium]
MATMLDTHLLWRRCRTNFRSPKRSVDPPSDCPIPVPLPDRTPPTALPVPGQSPLTGHHAFREMVLVPAPPAATPALAARVTHAQYLLTVPTIRATNHCSENGALDASMTFAIAIRQHGEPIRVEPGETILEAALAQSVPYPHGCRSGNCGACKS